MTATQAWREQAVNAVVHALYSRHPELLERLDQRGLAACRQDIQHRLDFLDGALAADETALFTNYATWLRDVLDSRGVSSSHLIESFDLLGKFLSEHLPAARNSGNQHTIFARKQRVFLAATLTSIEIPCGLCSFSGVLIFTETGRLCTRNHIGAG